MLVQPHVFRAAALAALALFATSATSAQGLGGMLNQAKAKARQAADRAANQTTSAVLNGRSGQQKPADAQSKTGPADGQSKTSPANGQAKGDPTDELSQNRDPLDSPPSELTAETQVAYIRAQMADTRPVAAQESRVNPSPNENYRRLRQIAKIAIPFTWDEAAVQAATAQSKPLWDYINYMSYNLVSGLRLENGPYLKSALQRVKEIHLTRKRVQEQFTELAYSFDAGTGVLTAALNVDEEGNVGSSSSAELDDWMVHNMTKAPMSRIERENEARFRYAREHPSGISTAPASGGGGGGSSAKSWTCTWCHQSVTAASRPSLAGCPRNSAHQHAWHN